MTERTERRLPQWYIAAVTMASDVFTGSPDAIGLGMPYVNGRAGGKGVNAQRHGRRDAKHPPAPAPAEFPEKQG